MSRIVLLHYHVFKNAGTTVDWTLQRFFRDAHTAFEGKHARDLLVTDEIAAFLKERPSVQVLTSHHARFPVPRVPGWHIIPIVFVRHPIDRAASVYAFEKRQDGSRSMGAQNAKIMSMQEYFRWRLAPGGLGVIANGQVRVLSGAPRSVAGKVILKAKLPFDYLRSACGFTSPGKRTFRRTITNLRSCAILGLVERFDESMVYMEWFLRQYFPTIDLSYVRQNVTHSRRKSLKERIAAFEEELGDTGLVAKISRWNQLDLDLYNWAQEEFERRIANVAEFSALLQDFRQRQSKLARSLSENVLGQSQN